MRRLSLWRIELIPYNSVSLKFVTAEIDFTNKSHDGLSIYTYVYIHTHLHMTNESS